MISKYLPVKRINLKITSGILTSSGINYNKIRYYSRPTIFISLIILCILVPSPIFNILTSVLAGILMIKTLKNVIDSLISIQFQILFAFVIKKLVVVHS